MGVAAGSPSALGLAGAAGLAGSEAAFALPIGLKDIVAILCYPGNILVLDGGSSWNEDEKQRKEERERSLRGWKSHNCRNIDNTRKMDSDGFKVRRAAY